MGSEPSPRAPVPGSGPHARTSGSALKANRPILSGVVLILLVGALVWTAGEGPPPGTVVVENPGDAPRHADVVLRARGGAVSASLLRLVEPGSSLGYRIPAGAAGCVRWIDDGSVRAAWAVPRSRTSGAGTVLELSRGGAASSGACPPELVRHRIRPALGRWMNPGDAARIHRERMIPRILHRRAIRRTASNRRRVTYWHLTPRGWIRGGWATRDDLQQDHPPPDRALTCAFVEERPTRLIRPTRRVLTVWKGDRELSRTLTHRFGPCPGSHDRRT
ncbi:MAG: hypothetical protein R3223_03900 [Longimicrobiales bacterium]|nr:hypothetical protein [Longimicrobiales bacterium]